MTIQHITGVPARHQVAVPQVRLVAARRAVIRLRAARTANAIIRELTAVPHEPVPGRRPLTARFDQLTERYAALGGDPSHLLR